MARKIEIITGNPVGRGLYRDLEGERVSRSWTLGPRNLLKALAALTDTSRRVRQATGVGYAYMAIDGVRVGNFDMCGVETMAEARDLIARVTAPGYAERRRAIQEASDRYFDERYRTDD